jgi:hypothetical protein
MEMVEPVGYGKLPLDAKVPSAIAEFSMVEHPFDKVMLERIWFCKSTISLLRCTPKIALLLFVANSAVASIIMDATPIVTITSAREKPACEFDFTACLHTCPELRIKVVS